MQIDFAGMRVTTSWAVDKPFLIPHSSLPCREIFLSFFTFRWDLLSFPCQPRNEMSFAGETLIWQDSARNLDLSLLCCKPGRQYWEKRIYPHNSWFWLNLNREMSSFCLHILNWILSPAKRSWPWWEDKGLRSTHVTAVKLRRLHQHTTHNQPTCPLPLPPSSPNNEISLGMECSN